MSIGYIVLEWEAIRQHDVLFLITIHPPQKSEATTTSYNIQNGNNEKNGTLDYY